MHTSGGLICKICCSWVDCVKNISLCDGGTLGKPKISPHTFTYIGTEQTRPQSIPVENVDFKTSELTTKASLVIWIQGGKINIFSLFLSLLFYESPNFFWGGRGLKPPSAPPLTRSLQSKMWIFKTSELHNGTFKRVVVIWKMALCKCVIILDILAP